MDKTQPVSIIVPTLNEAGNLPLLFKRIDATMTKARIPYEIILIDDKSTDQTKQIAEQSHRKFNIRAFTKRGKRGKAYSLLEGFEAAKYDLVCMVDADLQYPPEAIPQMYHKMLFCNADIVITNRIDNKTSALRKLVSNVFHAVFTRALFGISYDTQSGLKLFKKSVLQNITIAPSAWTFDMEFIIRSLEKNYTILSEDIPFSERNAGTPKIHIVSATLELAWQSLKLRRGTSVKRVKQQYKNLKPLQRLSSRGFNSVLVVLFSVLLLGAVHTSHTSALSLPTLEPISNAVDDLTQPVSDLLNNVVADPGSVMATAPTTSGMQQSSSLPASTNSNSSNIAVQSGATGKTAATTTNATQLNNSTATGTITESAAASNPTVLTPQTGKNAAYYPTSKLAANKTNQFLELATKSLEVGGAFILIGILFVGYKKCVPICTGTVPFGIIKQ